MNKNLILVLGLLGTALIGALILNNENQKSDLLNQQVENSVNMYDGNLAATSPTMLDVINSNPNYSTFAKLMKDRNMENVFNRKGTFTVFVPTNVAFEKYGEENLEMLLDKEEKLSETVGYHIVIREVELPSAELQLSANGLPLLLGVDTINEASITEQKQEATNGDVYGIDTILSKPVVPEDN